MAPIVIFTRLTAQPGRRAELLAAFAPLLDAVADEPGTEVFVMHTARDDADVVLFYEVYRDEVALATHRESEAVRPWSRDSATSSRRRLRSPMHVRECGRRGRRSPSS